MSGNGKRKPAGSVRAIRGEFKLDEVADADYEVAVEAQTAVLRAQGVERRILGKLRARLKEGAKDLGQRYYFDFDLGIVRRRETGRTGT